MSLRAQILSGGVYLVVRQGLGLLLNLLAVFLVVKVIGPSAYGVYSSALGVAGFVLQVASLGVNVYLIRSPDLEEKDYHAALAFYMVVSLVLAFLAYPLGKAMQSFTKIEGLSWAVAVLVWSLCAPLIGYVFIAKLERTLDFRRVALAELAGSFASLMVSTSMAWRGWGYWAPILGWLTGQVVITLLAFRFAGIRVYPKWHADRVRAMLSYGLGFSGSLWIWQGRSLVLPMVVAPWAGAEGTGYVALAIRLVEALAFVKNAAWRISIAALAHVQRNKERLRWAVEEGMVLQVLALGPLLLSFMLLGPKVVPILLGETWQKVFLVFPFIALAYVVNSVFSLHSSALYVLKRNWDVAVFHLVHIVVFFAATWFFVRAMGFVGYGWGEVVAFLSYVVIHLYFVRVVGPVSYVKAITLILVFGLPLFASSLGTWTFLPLVIWLANPLTWRELGFYLKTLGRKHA